jgi:hypothetical protein
MRWAISICASSAALIALGIGSSLGAELAQITAGGKQRDYENLARASGPRRSSRRRRRIYRLWVRSISCADFR